MLNNAIRKITPAGVVTTYAGVKSGGGGYVDGPPTTAKFYYPTAITIDSAGNLFVADNQSHKIRKVNASDAFVSFVAGGGSGTATNGGGYYASVGNNIYGLTVDSSGNLYVSDQGNARVRKIVINTTISNAGFVYY